MTARFFLCTPSSGGDWKNIVSAQELALVFDHAAVSVWADMPMIAIGDRGCIIGHLFTRDRPAQRVDRLDSLALDCIFRSNGRSLLQDFWGGYIAVYLTPDGTVSVLRDPSGMMPCYVRRHDGAYLLSAETGLLMAPGNRDKSVDFLECARLLSGLDGVSRKTCLIGVEELVAGECITIRHGRTSIESWWSPWDFVIPSYPRTPNETAESLHETVTDCVRSWESCFGSILLGVSGGLDSSILAASLMRQPTDLRCLTMVGPDAEGDETRYVNMLVEALGGIALATCQYEVEQVDVQCAVLPHLPWPTAPYFAQAIQAAHETLNQDLAIDAFFTGNGGDNVFCNLRSASPLVDRYLIEGLGPGAFHTLGDLCDLTEVSALTALKAAWRKYRRRAEGHRIVRNPVGLTETILASLDETAVSHPWLAMPPKALPGKAAHIALLMRAQKSIELYSRKTHPPQIAPLLSQPIMELCLSIPTWEWIAGGINRAPARAAFCGLLPDMLLKRTSKGGPAGFTQSLYEANASELNTMLRHGLLMANGLLDPGYLDQPDDPTWRGRTRAQRLLSFGAAECWARTWSEAKPAAVTKAAAG